MLPLLLAAIHEESHTQVSMRPDVPVHMCVCVRARVFVCFDTGHCPRLLVAMDEAANVWL